MSVAWAAASALTFLLGQDPGPPRGTETVQLDIDEKRIHQEGFEASTMLRLEPADGSIAIRIGAAVFARSIDVVLRNVRGTYRFHADTSRLEGLRLPAPAEPSGQVQERQ